MDKNSKYEYTSIRDFPIPISYPTENSVLGMLISNPAFLSEARNKLEHDSFYDPLNSALWDLLCTLDDTGKDITLETVFPKVDTAHFQNLILPRIVSDISLSESIDLINSLWFLHMKRKAYFAAMNMLRSACGDSTPDDSYNIAVNFVQDIEKGLQDSTTVPFNDAINTFSEELQKREADRKAGIPSRVPTSFSTLDFVTFGGFAKGNLVIIAARPSVGKTALSWFIARKMANEGFTVSYFSLEMTNNELVQRAITATGQLNGWEMAQGKVDWKKFDDAVSQIATNNINVNDSAYTLNDITSKISVLHKQGRCDVAFIDYLGLMTFNNSNQSVNYQIAEATKKFKRIAKQCSVPIVLLCQLNRDMSKDGREPKLHDLRDSGAIEQDADIVLMLDRKITDEDEGKDLRVFVRKNRQGPAGMCINLRLDDTYNNYYEKDENCTLNPQQIDNYYEPETRSERSDDEPAVNFDGTDEADDGYPF